MKINLKNDEKFIRKCIKLSENSLKNGDAPFGSIVVQNGKIISESINNSKNKISDHAEIIALHKASQKLKVKDLSSCTLYSNCEPCPMCSFMLREYKIGRVVFALPSPFVGGYSKWGILQDTEMSQFELFFNKPPKVTVGILEDEAKQVFDEASMWGFGGQARKELKLREMVNSIFSYPKNKKEILKLMSVLDISKEKIIQAYVNYDMYVFSYNNTVYNDLSLRFSLYLHYILKKSWHQEKQDIILDYIKEIKPNSIVDMGFGAPTKYFKEYVLKNKKKLVLVDLYKPAFTFAEALLNIWDSSWKDLISFKKLDMNTHKLPGDFDCYIFQDSIEHIKDAKKYLTKIVKSANLSSNFILSVPIGPKIPSHTISWGTSKEALTWLRSCGLKVQKSKKVFINPKADLFTDNPKEFYNLIVLCIKK